MKKAVILHGTDGTPDGGWRPFVKNELEKRGYEVWVPHLPNNHTPNYRVYNDFLFGSKWDFSDNLLIGHSSGATTVLNMLMDKRCPEVAAAVMVGAWSENDAAGLDSEQFKDVFPPEGFDFKTIKNRAPKRLFVHGDNDPWCPLDQAQGLARDLDCEIVVIPGGGHLGADNGYTNFPELIEILEMRQII